MLKTAQKKIDPNTMQVEMPRLYNRILQPRPTDSTGTLLMALCMSEDESSTQNLRYFLSTFPTEIDLETNKFSTIVLCVSIVYKRLLANILFNNRGQSDVNNPVVKYEHVHVPP